MTGDPVTPMDPVPSRRFSMTAKPTHIHPVFDRLLQRSDKEAMLGQHGLCIWMTGLSGSGKSTIAVALERLLHAEGILATFSCSGLVAPDLFQKVVFGAAVDAGRPVQVLEWLHQASDHPVAITFPEGAYLKGLICRVGQP